MAREIDDKKTRKALRKLRKARDRATQDEGPGLTEWEKEFVDGVEKRLETYGSAFNDPEKGALDEALSARQTQIVREIDKKAKKPRAPLKRSSFSKKTPNLRKTTKQTSSYGRDINEDIDEMTSAPLPEKPATPKLAAVNTATQIAKAKSPAHSKTKHAPAFRVIKGGKSAD